MKQINELKRNLLYEKIWNDRAQASIETFEKNQILKENIILLKKIVEKHDIKIMITAEKEILKFDLREYSNSNQMYKSLSNAIQEMDIALDQIEILLDHEAYSKSARNYALPKNQRNGLPLDEARQVFSSHMTRLENLDRARSSDLDKQVLDARKNMWRKARSIYIDMQKDFVNATRASNLRDNLGSLMRSGAIDDNARSTPMPVNKNSTQFKQLLGREDKLESSSVTADKSKSRMKNG